MDLKQASEKEGLVTWAISGSNVQVSLHALSWTVEPAMSAFISQEIVQRKQLYVHTHAGETPFAI